MKALILAGGFGTRLRPLSCTRPKLMFPVANRPILDWTIENLAGNGVNEVILGVNYMADLLSRYFGDCRYGMNIRYSRETKPLGTGGPIKKAEEFLKRDDNPFFVLNGDILSTIDYNELYEAHRKSGAEATIALREVDDPSRFGVVEVSDNDRIVSFVEKPKPGEEPSRLVNAGVYVLNQSILEIIPAGRQVSLEREIFPRLANQGRLYGQKFDSLWVDTGKPSDYFRANRLMLDLIAQNQPQIDEDIRKKASTIIIPPSVIGKGVEIGDETCIGPYTAIGEEVMIGKGARIENSIIFPHVWIENFASMKGAVIGEGAVIGLWAKIEEQCIIGDHAMIDNNVTLTRNVKICHNKHVETSILNPGTVM